MLRVIVLTAAAQRSADAPKALPGGARQDGNLPDAQQQPLPRFAYPQHYTT